MKRTYLLAGLLAPLAAYAYACGGSSSPDMGSPPDASAGGDAPGGADAPAPPGDASSDAGVPVPDGAAIACADKNPLKNPYFGDLHSHTSYSFDAYSFDTRNTPMDGFAFARGMPVQVAGA